MDSSAPGFGGAFSSGFFRPFDWVLTGVLPGARPGLWPFTGVAVFVTGLDTGFEVGTDAAFEVGGGTPPVNSAGGVASAACGVSSAGGAGGAGSPP